jgi:hypothetical protein
MGDDSAIAGFASLPPRGGGIEGEGDACEREIKNI